MSNYSAFFESNYADVQKLTSVTILEPHNTIFKKLERNTVL